MPGRGGNNCVLALRDMGGCVAHPVDPAALTTCEGIFLHAELESDPTKGRTIKRTRCSDKPITGIPAGHEGGAKCASLCRRHGMSEGTFCTRKTRYGGMTVSHAN